MKKLMYLAVVALVFTACAKEEVLTPENGKATKEGVELNQTIPMNGTTNNGGSEALAAPANTTRQSSNMVPVTLNFPSNGGTVAVSGYLVNGSKPDGQPDFVAAGAKNSFGPDSYGNLGSGIGYDPGFDDGPGDGAGSGDGSGIGNQPMRSWKGFQYIGNGCYQYGTWHDEWGTLPTGEPYHYRWFTPGTAAEQAEHNWCWSDVLNPGAIMNGWL